MISDRVIGMDEKRAAAVARAAGARAARTRAKHLRWAQEMRDAGWTVEEPK